MALVQLRCFPLATQRIRPLQKNNFCCRIVESPLVRSHRSQLTGSYHIATSFRSSASSTDFEPATREEAVVSDSIDTVKHNGNISSSTGASAQQTEADPQSSWGVSAAPEEDWQGEKSFSFKNVDWGLAGLLGVILFLSFGAYRVLNHFRVYHHQQRPSQPQVTSVIERQSPAAAAAATTSKSKSGKSRSKQDKASKSTTSATASAFPAAAAAISAAEGSSVPGDLDNSQSAAAQHQALSPGDFSAAAADGSSMYHAQPGADTAAVPSFEDLPGPSVPGAPQPSPLDAGFSSLPTPWVGSELGHMDLGALPPLPQGLAAPPELPSIQVEPPAKAVRPAEVSQLPSDPSLPSLRERAHIAMRASGAAMEASQRAAAYSAAASSAASRAAESAEQAAVAAAAVQTALESAAEEAMAEAVKRMNRAVEMVADAESRAAAAAAMATAYQDISDSQALAAQAAADLPQMPAKQTPQGHIANLRKVLHEQLFDTGAVISDWLASVWAAIVGAIAWLQGFISGLWAQTLGRLFAGSGGPAGAAGGPAAGPAVGGANGV